MFFNRWQQWLWQRSSSRSSRQRPTRVAPRRGRRLLCEPLEDRRLLTYSVTDLGTFFPTHINAAGVVIGHSAVSGNTYDHAVVWTKAGGLQDLGTLGGTRSSGTINEAGVVVGSSTLASGETHGFLIQPLDTDQDGTPDVWFQDANQDGINDLMIDFATAGIPLAGATDINDSGQILFGLKLWDRATGLQTVFDSQGAYGYSAVSLNNADQAAGSRLGPFGTTYAYLYSGGQAINLGHLPGDAYARATDLNDLGQVVGTSGMMYATGMYGYFKAHQAFLWANEYLTGLGVLPGETASEASAVNSLGQVVGGSYLASAGFPVSAGSATNARAFIWDQGVITDLNSLVGGPSAWVLANATGIIDQGQIVGTGTLGGQTHAFLLTPQAPSAAIRVQPLSGLSTTEAGGTVQFSVKLNTQPTANVIVPITSSDTTDGTVSVSSLTFTPDNWNIAQSVTVTGVDDPVYDGNIAYKIAIGPAVSDDPAYNGLTTTDLSLTNIDDDPPTVLKIDSASVIEGNSGTTSAVLTVTRTGPIDQTTTVNYSTSTATCCFGTPATAGTDFTAVIGTLTFAAGETSHAITVLVNGDKVVESDEEIPIVITNPTNAIIYGGLGLVTILNDDPPAITINDVSGMEGSSGLSYFVFTISLSVPTTQTVSVNFATANGTAKTSDNDYVAATGTLTFAPGETTKTISVAVKGDTKKENNETFFLNLSGAANATILDGQGLGTILNDD